MYEANRHKLTRNTSTAATIYIAHAHAFAK